MRNISALSAHSALQFGEEARAVGPRFFLLFLGVSAVNPSPHSPDRRKRQWTENRVADVAYDLGIAQAGLGAQFLPLLVGAEIAPQLLARGQVVESQHVGQAGQITACYGLSKKHRRHTQAAENADLE